jgi:hypothetical protein
MNEQQLAAVKQALEALEICEQGGYIPVRLTRDAIATLQSIISQDALYKMAEDAVTIGLSYNDWDKIGCVNHDCDKCKAVQEPWVGLTDEERRHLRKCNQQHDAFAQAIEAKLKEKNHG